MGAQTEGEAASPEECDWGGDDFTTSASFFALSLFLSVWFTVCQVLLLISLNLYFSDSLRGLSLFRDKGKSKKIYADIIRLDITPKMLKSQTELAEFIVDALICSIMDLCPTGAIYTSVKIKCHRIKMGLCIFMCVCWAENVISCLTDAEVQQHEYLPASVRTWALKHFLNARVHV